MTTGGDYIGTPALRDRGWTEAAIKRFLGEPDKRIPNPVYRSAAPARLYSTARAAQAEAASEWQQWRRAADQRSARSTAVASAKRAALLAEVDALDIRVPVVSLDVLAAQSVRHRNARDAERAWDRGEVPFSADASTVGQETLDRWMVNYLRHHHTSYDADLSQLYGKVGRQSAQAAIRRRVYEVIAGTYTSLAAECARQLTEREAGGVT